MPSKSREKWSGERSDALDQIASAHSQVGGTARGRRFATEQINHAYTTLLSSQFQGFARDLHTECLGAIVAGAPAGKLEKGNPNPGNIGADFGKFGLKFWDLVRADSPRNDRRQAILEALNEWRNAIAHQDFDPARLGGTTTLHLQAVRRWRSALNHLASSFDNVMRFRIYTLTNANPW
jgi:hypothetical protein